MIAITMSACGGGGSTVTISTGGEQQDPIAELSDIVNDELPGTVVYVSGSESYDAAFQIGGSVLVVDSSSVDNSYEIKNTLVF